MYLILKLLTRLKICAPQICSLSMWGIFAHNSSIVRSHMYEERSKAFLLQNLWTIDVNLTGLGQPYASSSPTTWPHICKETNIKKYSYHVNPLYQTNSNLTDKSNRLIIQEQNCLITPFTHFPLNKTSV
jgi:hypothetical protein